jgi:hypothetical protein
MITYLKRKRPWFRSYLANCIWRAWYWQTELAFRSSISEYNGTHILIDHAEKLQHPFCMW